jgi:putative membrane-bound dehydrogenase-like protein
VRGAASPDGLSRSALELGIALFTAALVSSISAAQFQFPGHTLTVPDGFIVEQVAAPPLVDRPISIALDEQGRLYATDSAGMTDKAPEQIKTKPHRIVRLEDTDGDGRYDKSVVFADKMMFPEGAMFYEGSLYVAAPPEIWKLTDTNGDGVADRREVWFDGKTLTGCANDLHGPYLGRDGWFYWCKGAFAEQKYTLPNGKPFTTRASHIFRARPDGTGIEPVMTGGMDNPVDVTFTASGERIFCTTFFQQPGGGLRDGLIHAIYGGVYGKQHDVLNGHPRTGELMPVLTHMGAAAPAGLTTYDSSVFGGDFRDNLFACYFNLHKVSRHVLMPDGATFKTVDSDFLVSDNPDFHPTDVIEDADGSLLVVDTGGWYKICCPTSQLWKPDVLGAIYRVRRTGAPKLADPRGLKINWTKQSPAQLAKLLSDERLFVQQRAIHELGKRGKEAVKALQAVLADKTAPAPLTRPSGTLSPRRTRGEGRGEGSLPLSNAAPAVSKLLDQQTQARINAIWALTRIDHESARQAIRSAIYFKDEPVRLAAIHSASLWRDRGALTELSYSLNRQTAATQRAAAEALGRIGDAKTAPTLLNAAASLIQGQDGNARRTLEHSLAYALIETGDANATSKGIASVNVWERRVALLALDQMENSPLKAADVVPLLNSKETALRQTAEWIIGHRPEWSRELTTYFQSRLQGDLSATQRDELQSQLTRLASDATMQDFIARMIGETGVPESSRQVLLRAMQQASLKQTPATWNDALKGCLSAADKETIRAAVATVRALPLDKKNPAAFTDALLKVAGNAALPADLRVDGLAAITGGLSSADANTFQFLTSCLAPAQPPLLRNAAASVLARARLTDEQLLALTGPLKDAGSMELATLLGAFERAKSEQVGFALIDSLAGARSLAALRADMLNTCLAKYPASVQQRGEELIKRLDSDSAAQKAKLHELATNLPAGDIRRGQALFRSEKTACAACHAIGYLGGKIGPDLTRIGQVRTEADLIESIVFPSRTFVRSYEPFMVLTKDGESYTGIIKNESSEGVQLVSAVNVEPQIPRANIAEMRPGQLSIMPAGLDQALSRQELADLVAFLRSLK